MQSKPRYILAVLLLSLCFSCAAPQALAEAADAETAKEHMLSVWYDYLDLVERQSSARLWACS